MGKRSKHTSSPKKKGKWKISVWKDTYVSGELDLKTTMRVHCTATRRAKMENTDSAKSWQECGTAGTFIHCICIKMIHKMGDIFLWREAVLPQKFFGGKYNKTIVMRE